MRAASWFVVVMVAACGANAPEPPPPRLLEVPLTPRTYHLPNGLTAILVPDANADLVSVLVQYDVGAIDDPVGQEGVAHLAAHVSYAPVRTGRLTLWDELDAISTWINTTPTDNHTDFTEQCQPEQLADVLRVEARRLSAGCDGVTDVWFDWLRTQVRDETRVNNTRVTNRDVNHALYAPSDPFYRAYDASPERVESLTRDATCAFIDHHYGPQTATVVVSGPIDPTAFEALLKRDLARIPVGHAAPRATVSAANPHGHEATARTDVSEPTLAISWPLPADEGERSVMTLAVSTLARNLKCSTFSDENQMILWCKKSEHGGDKASEIIRATLRSPLITPSEFERARTMRVTGLLLALDTIPTRLKSVARRADVDAPFRRLERVTVQGFDAIVDKDLAWDRATVLNLEPDGTRPAWRPTSLADPPHDLRGPSSFPPAVAAPTPPPDSRVLAKTRSFHLANGLQVVFVPTSPVPVIDIALGFRVGVASEPSDHHGTAAIALSAMKQLGSRGQHAQDSSWAIGSEASGAGADDSGIRLIGPTMYSDLLMSQFDGLAHETFQVGDVQKGYEAMVRIASSPVHRVWDDSSTVRTSLYGADHPYGQAKLPEKRDVASFDARAVEDFYRRYLQPNNATLIVTGGFDPDAMTELVHRTFDGWQGKGEARVMQLPHGKVAKYASADQDSAVHLGVSWIAHGDAYEPRMLLANTLGAMSARVHARYGAQRQGGFYFLAGNFEPGTAAAEIKEIARRLPLVGSGDPWYRTGFETARLRAVRATIGGARSSGEWENWIGWSYSSGHDVKWLAGSARRYAAVTYEEVAKLAATELSIDAATWYVSGPHDAVADTYAALGFAPIWINH